MRKIILFCFSILLLPYISYTQTVEEIDLKSNILLLEKTVEPGEYVIDLTNFESTSLYEISLSVKDIEQDVLTYTTLEDDNLEKAIDDLSTYQLGKFKVKKNQQLTVDIKEIKSDKTEKKIKRIWSTKANGKWQTTFGFNFVKLNNETFFSKPTENEFYEITRSNTEREWDYYPSIMFTWIKNNQNEFKIGISGGFGYDLESSISIFTGGSIIYNQNIIITAGLAFHNQQKLSSKYKESDIILEELDFDQLHSDFIAINPFISISLRLDKNPFKK